MCPPASPGRARSARQFTQPFTATELALRLPQMQTSCIAHAAALSAAGLRLNNQSPLPAAEPKFLEAKRNIQEHFFQNIEFLECLFVFWVVSETTAAVVSKFLFADLPKFLRASAL
jgi:hypothetical protein